MTGEAAEAPMIHPHASSLAQRSSANLPAATKEIVFMPGYECLTQLVPVVAIVAGFAGFGLGTWWRSTRW